MTITRNMALFALAIVTACAIALAGCGSTSASSGANESESANDTASAAPTQQADERALPYVGTWKGNEITLGAQTNASSKETDLDVPVSIELDSDMTGTLTVGTSEQEFEWEVREWDNLELERVVVTLHETFEIENLVCDPEHLMLEFEDSQDCLHLFADWKSTAEPGVRIKIDTMVEKAA